MNSFSLEESVTALLSRPVAELENAYPDTNSAAEELVPLRRSLQQDMTEEPEKYLEVADTVLETLHEKILNSSCESALWGALIWNLAKPLPSTIAHDLIDRGIALTDLEHSRQTDEVQWRMAENQREALLTLAIDFYTKSSYNEAEFQHLLQKFPDSRWMLETLAYRQPSSPAKEKAFLNVLSRHPEVEKIQRRHRLHNLINRAYQATNQEEIEALYAEKETPILRGLAENLHTPPSILEELASMTGQIRHFARENLRRQRSEKLQQPQILLEMSAEYIAALSDLAKWDALTFTEHQAIAMKLASKLPKDFHFQGIETHLLSGQEHLTAFYLWKESRFALILGGKAVLGFDRNTSGFPNETQQENWKATEEDFQVSLEDFLEGSMTSRREADIKPFLIEVKPKKLPEYTDWHRVTKRIAQQGFWLPTPDEWEYACGAGSRTLFRWGNTCPLDTLPIDKSKWNLHQQPNAFGLQMPSNPYHWEFTSEPGIMRGGDGGSTICGGMAELAGWLPLATAFTTTWKDTSEVIGAYLRRVFPLS